MSHLLSEINSLHLKALDAKDKRIQKVYVFVEGKSDIAFWRQLFINNGISNIEINYGVQAKGTGKMVILKNLVPAENLLLCLDSDYDYIYQDDTELSRKFNNNDFVFQTFSYSLENIYCWNEGIRSLMNQLYGEDFSFPVVDFLISYSRLINPLFKYSIYFDKEYRMKLQKGNHMFSIHEFERTSVLPNHFDLTKLDEIFDFIAKNIASKITSLGELSQINLIEERLLNLEISEDLTYLFIKGHFLMDSILIPILKKVISPIHGNRYKEIRTSVNNIDSQILDYNKMNNIKTLLESNENVKDCPLYKKIESEIINYKSKYYSLN